MMTCKALIIKFSFSSVLPDDSLRMTLRRGKQKEKAGADSGATSKEQKPKETGEQWLHSNYDLLIICLV